MPDRLNTLGAVVVAFRRVLQSKAGQDARLATYPVLFRGSLTSSSKNSAGDSKMEYVIWSTRLRIMALPVSLPETDRLAYGFIQKTLVLTGGNLTTHLRKL